MSKPVVQSYLFFNGNCEEALEFYKTALDAKVDMVMRFSDSPEPCGEGQIPPGHENKIMHASFHVGDTMIMASDGCGETYTFAGFSLSLALGTEAEADKYFNALAEGGEVTMPLGKTFWSPRFGMLKDKFGMGWMINVVPVEP
ncbi:MAG: VOC family protein [Verrucomicrobiota bacterium]